MKLNAEHIRYKMSEKQIKTALECLSKPNSSPADREKCYFMWKEPSCLSCYHEVAQNALALITSQEQRINELTEENERLRCEVADLKDELKCEKETNAHLCSQYMSENHLRYQAEEMLANGMSVVKADTVNKMHSEIKERCIKGGIYPAFVASTIDRIAKEMLEGTDEEG